jgi:hypothetical protein
LERIFKEVASVQLRYYTYYFLEILGKITETLRMDGVSAEFESNKSLGRCRYTVLRSNFVLDRMMILKRTLIKPVSRYELG